MHQPLQNEVTLQDALNELLWSFASEAAETTRFSEIQSIGNDYRTRIEATFRNAGWGLCPVLDDAGVERAVDAVAKIRVDDMGGADWLDWRLWNPEDQAAVVDEMRAALAAFLGDE